MLWKLVVILPALAWRIQAQNGITPASIDSDMAFAPTDQGEFGSSENESEDLKTVASSEVEIISSELLTTTQGGFQVNEARILNTVPLPQVTTLANDDSSETDQTSFADANGLSDTSDENTFTEKPNGSQELEENSEQNDSDEVEPPDVTDSSASPSSSTGERSDEGSNGNSGKEDSPSGERTQFRAKRETGIADPNKPTGESPLVQAFSVGIFDQRQFPSKDIPVRLESVFFNEGQMYNNSTGKFMIKISGVYSLTYSAIFSSKIASAVLIRNNKPVINSNVFQGKGNNNLSSASLILRLKSKDEIWFEFKLESKNRKQKTIVSKAFIFSGFLLSL